MFSRVLRPATRRRAIIATGSRQRPSIISRHLATTESPPPPPPHAETFSRPSRPHQYYERPRPKNAELPNLQSSWPSVAVACAVGVALWGGFLLYATNSEKLASSVVQQVLAHVKDSSSLRDVLGEKIRPQPEWYLNGNPRIEGEINQLKGKVDVSMRLTGPKGSGTLYFSSIRPTKGAAFQTLRFRVICDDGQIVQLDSTDAVSLPVVGS